MSSPQEPPPEGGDVDRGGTAVIVFWVFSAVSVVVVALRFIGRRMIRATGWDDWTMLFTLALLITYSAFITLIAQLGGMRHLYYLTPDQTVAAVRMSWISQPFVVVGFATGKIAVALLLLRIIGPQSVWRKWILRVCIVASLVFSTVDVTLTFAQCRPVQGLWDSSLLESGAATCIDPNIEANESIWLASWNVFVDTLLALLPATLFWKLRLNFRRKIGLCILLGLGIIAAVCAAVKAQFLGSLGAWSDLTWVTYDLYMWSGAELFVIIVTGSIPPIKPIYDRLFGRRKSDTAKGTGYPSYPGSTLRGTHWSSSNQPTSGIDRKIEVLVHDDPRDPFRSPRPPMNDEELGQYPRFVTSPTRPSHDQRVPPNPFNSPRSPVRGEERGGYPRIIANGPGSPTSPGHHRHPSSDPRDRFHSSRSPVYSEGHGEQTQYVPSPSSPNRPSHDRPHAPPRVGSGPVDYPKPGNHIRPFVQPADRLFPAGDITVPFR